MNKALQRPEFLEASRALAHELGLTPRRISPTRWAFTASSDQSEPEHFVDLIGGKLYCSCVGFTIHKHCKHADRVREIEEMTAQETRSLVVADPTGMPDVWRSPQDLAHRLNDMMQERALVQAFLKEVMIKDEDYGVIPGTDKPTLYKAGAEKLNEFYGYAPVIVEKQERSDEITGQCRYVITVALVHKTTGVKVAESVGECSTREAKYAYRWVFANDIPDGLDKTKLKTRSGKSKRTGNAYTLYRIENDDLASIWNTVLKMAFKRAYVGATHQATRSSGIFTQTEKDLDEWVIEGVFRPVDEDDDDPLKGDLPPMEAAPARPSTPTPTPAAPAQPRPQQREGAAADAMTMFWTDARNAHLEQDAVIDASQRIYNNREPKDLTEQERIELLRQLTTPAGDTAQQAGLPN